MQSFHICNGVDKILRKFDNLVERFFVRDSSLPVGGGVFSKIMQRLCCIEEEEPVGEEKMVECDNSGPLVSIKERMV